MPVSFTLCGLVTALCQILIVAFSAVVGVAVGVNTTLTVHPVLAFSVDGQPDTA